MPHTVPEVERLLAEIRSRVRHVEERRRSGATERELERDRNEIGRLKSLLADVISAETSH